MIDDELTAELDTGNVKYDKKDGLEDVQSRSTAEISKPEKLLPQVSRTRIVRKETIWLVTC